MDEAEQLCDKIAIMINGRFVVFGSPNYLKSQYGHGYSITIKQSNEAHNDANRNILGLI
jgi:ABC-type multidrug transport system ATPase subunit